MNSCCYCFNLKTGSTIAIIFTLIYSLIQLLSIVSSDPVVYGSVLHPPSLPRHDLLYYNSIALITYLSLLLFASPALWAIYKEKYFFLLPWLTANIVSALLEFLVFFHLLSKINKVGRGRGPHCIVSGVIPWCHLSHLPYVESELSSYSVCNGILMDGLVALKTLQLQLPAKLIDRFYRNNENSVRRKCPGINC